MGTVLAYAAEGLYLGSLQQEEGRGIAASERFQPVQQGQGFRSPYPEGNRQVIFHGGQEAFFRRGGGDLCFQAFPELRDQVGLHVQAGGLLMAAKALQQISAGGQHLVNVDTRNRPAGTHRCIAVNAEGNDREMEPLTQAPGSKADEPGVPVFTGDNDHMGVCQLVKAQLGQGGGGHFPLQVLAGPVRFLQEAGNVGSFGRIRGQEQVNAQFRVSQAAGGVQARAETEGEMIGGNGRLYAGVFQQGLQAGPGGGFHAFEAFPDDYPVFVLQGDNISHCS